MNSKDVIYIDVEDDITAIIGKVKAAKEKVVALVPPKRTGVLQSAVNLRLLSRAAGHGKKHIVLITGDAALMGLAASAKIPVAKNLQSKPEIPTVPALAVDDDDDIIDGEKLPIGEHAKTAPTKAGAGVPDSAVSGLDIDDDRPKAVPPVPGRAAAKSRVKSGVKVPSFSKFRKKIFLIAGGGILLLVFLVWAIWFAPQATVVIAAQTSDKDLKTAVTTGQDLTTDADEATIKSANQEEKETVSVDFVATGEEDKGEKAKGTVSFSTNSISNLGTTIPAGTVLTSSGGQTFVTNSSVTLTLSNYNGASASVTASASGEQFNGASGSVSGAPSGVSAQLSGSTSGGTTRVVKIVTQPDVQKAKEQLVAQNNDDMKKKLAAKFGKEYVVINESFTVSGGDATPSPGIGEEAPSGKAKLTRETTYTMTGIKKDELNAFLDSAFEKTLTSKEEQRVYSNGIDTVKFADFKQGERVATSTLTATGQIGPRIDDGEIKEQVKGKRYGEVQAELKAIEGVNDAETKFWPFWVQTVPNDTNKIKIEFKLKDGSTS